MMMMVRLDVYVVISEIEGIVDTMKCNLGKVEEGQGFEVTKVVNPSSFAGQILMPETIQRQWDIAHLHFHYHII